MSNDWKELTAPDELLAACKGLLKAHRVTASTSLPTTVQEAEKQLDVIWTAVEAATCRTRGQACRRVSCP